MIEGRRRREEGAFLARLREELAAWTGGGIITPEQEARIRARYDFSSAERESQAERNRVVAIITLAGAVLVGVGVILFFAANWPHIPRWGRFALVLLGMAALYGAAWELGWRRKTFPLSGRALAVAGCLLYGAGIWLVAQIFNISSHWPNGILLWAAGVFPLAAALGASPLASLYVILLTGWTACEVGGFSRANLVFFPLLLATAVPLCYRYRLRFPLWLSIIGVTAALGMDAAQWRLSWEAYHAYDWELFSILLVLGAWGGVLALLGRWQDRWEAFAPFSRAFRLPAFLLLGAVLPVFTFRDALRWLPEHGAEAVAQWFLLAAAAAALLLFLSLYRRWRGRWPDAGAAAMLIETAAAADSVLLLALLALGGRLLPHWLWALLFNLNLFALAAALVFVADRAREWWAGYLGVVVFTALVVCRYFEYAVRLLPKSLVFIAAGGFLLAGGLWLERRRRGSREVAS